MVKFKTIKYKHERQARELAARIEEGSALNEEMTAFVMSLVLDWDYKDPDTGEPVPPGEPDELSLEDFSEVIQVFNDQMTAIKLSVPKKSASQSPSGLTNSKTGKKQNPKASQSGLTSFS